MAPNVTNCQAQVQEPSLIAPRASSESRAPSKGPVELNLHGYLRRCDFGVELGFRLTLWATGMQLLERCKCNDGVLGMKIDGNVRTRKSGMDGGRNVFSDQVTMISR